MRLGLIPVCLCFTLLTSCDTKSASCTDVVVTALPDLLRIFPPNETTAAPGTTVDARAEVDSATRYVSLQLRSPETGESVGAGSAPSGTADVETVDVSISIEDDAPPGTYYIAADVCAASDCPDDEPRTSYRQTNDQNFLTKTRIEGSEQEAFTSCVAIHTVRIE